MKIIQGFLLTFLLFIMSCMLSDQLYAGQKASLLLAVKDAAENDPTFQMQIADFHDIEQDIPQNRSALMPQIDITGALEHEHDYMQNSGSGTIGPNNITLNLSQAVFNASAFRALQQAKLSVQAAAVNLSAQEQDLMLRTAAAYYEVLETNEILQYSRQQAQIIRDQLKATQTRFDYNEATITELRQVQGRYDLLAADVATAELNFCNAQQVLSEITAHHYRDFIKILRVNLISPKPNSLTAWVIAAKRDNLYLKARRLALVAALTNIHAKQANYFPTLSALAQASAGSQLDTDLFARVITEKTSNTTVGLSLNWAAYQGGLVGAQVKKAVAAYERSQAEVEQAYLKALSDVRQAYMGVVKGITRVRLDHQAVLRNQQAIDFAEEGYRAGVQTLTDLLQIQSQLLVAQRAYAEDKFDYLLDELKLQRAVGRLTVHSLTQG